ncbi:type II toxin-antitoxin system death-on-curing family toxin [Microbacterium sp. 10M-3C3]|uniref:type II toxin-antitoxin system death-on-curing family toxin n=1 Tax=Microbacterium sp. 10M-3C3 TaxID=2483401 RepID=UPI0013DDD78A|nr:type II toxin-antitoxin system death-on-curing family toxin [Microbacterium sp. 10M-3C3]
MAKKTVTPAALARDLGLEVDDVLLMLWDSGVDYPTSPDALIRPGDHQKAYEACGVASLKDRLLVDYWSRTLGMSRVELQTWAGQHGVTIGPNARRLPKGALARFERAMRSNAVSRAERRGAGEVPSSTSPRSPMQWRDVGHMRDDMRYLSADEIEQIHHQIAQDFRDTADPIAPAGVRSRELLESAAGRPGTGLGGYRKYPTIEMAAAALVHSVIHNHPFYNGNKRTALVSMLSFMDENGLVLTSSQDELFRWTVRVAGHKLGADKYTGDKSDVELQLMAQWLLQHSRAIEAGERVITFAELRRRLATFDCSVHITSNRGGRAIVERQVAVTQRSLLGSRRKVETRRVNLPYGGEGRQVARNRIKELRRELQLSDEFGIDSAAFYGLDKRPIDAFIAEYRKTLRRLARV